MTGNRNVPMDPVHKIVITRLTVIGIIKPLKVCFMLIFLCMHIYNTMAQFHRQGLD